MATQIGDMLSLGWWVTVQPGGGGGGLTPSPPFAARRTKIALANEGCEFRFRISNREPNAPVEIESLRMIVEDTSLV